MRVIRPQADSPLPTGTVYEHGRKNLQEFVKRGYLEKDDEERVYIYAQISNGKRQVGVVCQSSVEDYEKNKIKRHEATLKSRVVSLTKTCMTQNANTGLIFLLHKSSEEVNKQVNEALQSAKIVFDLITKDDGVQHQLWKVSNSHSMEICKAFAEHIEFTYIADGHHRSESALNMAIAKREQALKEGKALTGEEPFENFMTVIYPEEQLHIETFPRLIHKDPCFNENEIKTQLENIFEMSVLIKGRDKCEKGKLAVFLQGKWYLLEEKEKTMKSNALERLDVQMITDKIIRPILSKF